jgi:argininosuccinate lyase
MMATDLADYLVRKGATFREAHGAVGRLVRESETTGQELQSLPFASFTSAHASFNDDVYEALSAERSVLQREVEGGTGPAAVRAQIEAAQAVLAPPPPPRSTNVVL